MNRVRAWMTLPIVAVLAAAPAWAAGQPATRGLMTDQEWNAYNDKAEIIDEKNKLTEYRKSMITSRVQNIHGHYSTISMAPWFITNLGVDL